MAIVHPPPSARLPGILPKVGLKWCWFCSCSQGGMPAGEPLCPVHSVLPSLAMITPTWLREHVLCSSQAEVILINVSSIDGLLIGNPYAGNRTRFRFLEDRSC